MKFIKTPVKGMCDMLPQDMELRNYVLGMIKETYKSYGFSEIETPVMEHIENLTGDQGGENEKLIFKVMKRGEELKRAMESEDNSLADSGMRYDLTVPLSRYYANNMGSLITPFKALQIGNVFRADKPQKGRFRQFTQCDIDILGDGSILAEIELIAATANVLTRIFSEIGISKFTVHVNDRRILKAMALFAGFSEESLSSVLISLDKMDKIGLDGIKEEMIANGHLAENVEKYISLLENITPEISCSEFCKFLKENYIEGEVIESIENTLDCARSMVHSDVTLMFDPTLVRGMAYYTGTIFEISIDGYNFSIAGGGRYDEIIGKFSNQKVPACGFSIGFERIITILNDNLDKITMEEKEKVAILIEKGASSELMLEAFNKAMKLRNEGKIVSVQPLSKNAKFQVEKLVSNGYSKVEKMYI